MKDDDFISVVDAAQEEGYDSFFAPTEKRADAEMGAWFEPGAPYESESKAGQNQSRQMVRQKGSTHIRIKNDIKAFCYRSLQCYQLATGKKISLSSFIELCVKRALPHISKEASELMKQFPK